jgi:hypothetical protein
MQPDSFELAMRRMQRRTALWRAAREACPSYEAFRASTGAIERAIAVILARDGD